MRRRPGPPSAGRARRRQQHVDGLGGEIGDAAAEQFAQACRYPARRRSRELEREKRVAARELVQPRELGSGELHAEAVMQQLVDIRDPHRGRATEPVLDGVPTIRPWSRGRREHPTGSCPAAAARRGSPTRTRRPPLQIVQCDEDRSVAERGRAARPAARARSPGWRRCRPRRRAAARSPAPARRGAASSPATSSNTGATRSDSPANAKPPRPRRCGARARGGRARASSTPASQSTVLPMPGSPASRARPARRTRCRGRRISPSSSSRPMTAPADMRIRGRPSHAADVPPVRRRALSRRARRLRRLLGRRAGARVLGDELLGRLAGLVVGPLVVRRLHEVRARAVELAADAVVERELAAADGVDDDAGRVGRVPHLELELQVQRHVAERLALDADVRPLAVGEPRHVVRRADVDVVGGSSCPMIDVTAFVLEIFLDSSRSRSSMLKKSMLPPTLSCEVCCMLARRGRGTGGRGCGARSSRRPGT